MFEPGVNEYSANYVPAEADRPSKTLDGSIGENPYAERVRSPARAETPSMPIRTRCVSCDAEYNLADRLAGKQIKCKKCDAVFRVPETEAAEPPPKKQAKRSRNELDEDRPVAKTKKKTSPALPNDVRRAMALLIFLGFLQIVGIYLLRRAAANLHETGFRLSDFAEMLLTISTVLAGGIALAAFTAAYLLFAGIRFGRILAFLIAVVLLLF